MALSQINLTVTNTAGTIASFASNAYIPQNCQYCQIVNPNASASVAFTIDGSSPVVNANGVTIGSVGAETFDSPAGATFPLASVNLISSTTSQAVTVLWA